MEIISPMNQARVKYLCDVPSTSEDSFPWREDVPDNCFVFVCTVSHKACGVWLCDRMTWTLISSVWWNEWRVHVSAQLQSLLQCLSVLAPWDCMMAWLSSPLSCLCLSYLIVRLREGDITMRPPTLCGPPDWNIHMNFSVSILLESLFHVIFIHISIWRDGIRFRSIASTKCKVWIIMSMNVTVPDLISSSVSLPWSVPSSQNVSHPFYTRTLRVQLLAYVWLTTYLACLACLGISCLCRTAVL